MAEFVESDHPRDSDGKFGSGSGSGVKSSKLTANEKSSLSSYSGDDFLRINAELRAGNDSDPAVGRIDSAIAKSPLPKGTILYRGMSLEAARKLFPDGNITRGMTISDRAFASTSKSSHVARSIGLGGVVLKIESGANATGIDMAKHSRNSAEQEVLLPRNAKMKVLGASPPKSPGDPITVRVAYGDDMMKADAATADDPVDNESPQETDTALPPLRAAGILFITPSGKALLAKRAKVDGADHGGEWALPGGKIEDGETAEQAARRETLEEMGFDYQGELREWTRRIKDGVDFTTFVAVVKEFEPTLNDEHVDWTWVPRELALTFGTPPLHPGVPIALNKFDMNELDIARAIQAEELTSPQQFASFLLIAIRITGTGASYRPKDKQFVWREPAYYCNPEFVQRCSGLPVIWKHQTSGELLDSQDFVERIVGMIFLPFIRGEEVWGIAKIYDAECAKYLISIKASTSPFIAFTEGNSGTTIQQSDGKKLLIEGPPDIVDSVALLPSTGPGATPGVWDKGMPISGVESVTADSAEPSKLDVALRAMREVQIDAVCAQIGV